MAIRLTYSLALAAALTLGGCATGPEPLPAGPPPAVDLSGDWEKNYAQSDDFNTRFNLYLHDLQRALMPSGTRGSLGQAPMAGAYGGSMESIMGLARFVEEITRMPMLEITQQDGSIAIEREDDYALRCAWYDQRFARNDNPFGSELCGWNGQQLVFRISLRDGLDIYHQITLGPDRQELNITTTVSSANVGKPLTISNYYRRFQSPNRDYDCVLTLSRNNVCSRAEAGQ